jgi:hypothetical protein
MQQSKAIIVGSVIIGACILSFLGYNISRDRAEAKALQQGREQQLVQERRAERKRLDERMHELRLDEYERKFGHLERLKLVAFELGVRAEGVGAACKSQSLSPKHCETFEKNRQALLDITPFVRP